MSRIRVPQEQEIQWDQSSDLPQHSDNTHTHTHTHTHTYTHTHTHTLATTKSRCWLSRPLILAADPRLPTSSPLLPRSGWELAEEEVINNCHVCHGRAAHERGGSRALTLWRETELHARCWQLLLLMLLSGMENNWSECRFLHLLQLSSAHTPHHKTCAIVSHTDS